MNVFRNNFRLRNSLGVAIVYGLVSISGASVPCFAAGEILVNDGSAFPIYYNPAGITITGGGIIMNSKNLTGAMNLEASGNVTAGYGGANPITLNGSTGDVSSKTLQTSGLATLDSGQIDGALNVDGTTTLNDDLTLGGDILDIDGTNGILILNANVAHLTNADGHGLTVLGNTTTLSGGSNTSTWTLTDGSATLNVAGAALSSPDRELISATTDSNSDNPEVRTGAEDSGNVTVNDSGVHLSNNGSPARLTGVADGVNDFDAVNVRQLNTLSKKAFSGIAQIAAMTAIPAPTPGRHYSIGVGVGTYGGEQAIALGTKASVTDNIMFGASVGAGFSSGTPVAGAMGASISW